MLQFLTGLPRNAKRGIALIADLVIIPLSLWISYCLRLDQLYAIDARTATVIGLTTITTVLLFVRIGLYRAVIRFAGQQMVSTIFVGVSFSVLAFAIYGFILQAQVPRSVPFIYLGLCILAVVGTRMLMRIVLTHTGQQDREKVIVYGAGSAGVQYITASAHAADIQPVAFIDDDQSMQGTVLQGLPVYPPSQMPRLIEEHAPTKVILSISRLTQSDRNRILHFLSQYDLPVQKVSGLIRTSGTRTIKNVLLVGGGGYIGSALIKRMLEHGYYVRLLDKLVYGGDAISEFIEHPMLDVIEADFREVHRVVEAMEGIDAVVHLGAIVGDPACALDEDFTIETNLMATRMIAEVAKSHGVNRFIFASTCSVYGAGDRILDEGSNLNPVSLYAKSKIASEKILGEMADSGFNPAVVRFGTIYGLSGRTRFDLVVNLLTAKALTDGKITVFGGDQWRPFLHVQDAALAVFKVLEAPLDKVSGEVFNVGSNEQNYTIQEIGELVHDQVPNAELLLSDSDGDRRDYRVSFDKIKRVLGFEPEWTVEKGIHQVLTAMQSGSITDYQDARYNNAKFLSEAGAYQVEHSNDWAHQLIAEIDSSRALH